MNKLISIFILVVYTTVVSGITINLHYCGGKIASFNLSLSEEHPKCPCGSKKMNHNCCKDKSVHFQLKSEQKAQHFSLLKIISPKNNTTSCFLKPSFSLSDIARVEKKEVAHPPPLFLNSNPPYLLNRVFRI